MDKVATINIKNLRLRTFIGFNKEEREKKQDIVINLSICYPALKAAQTDDIYNAYNYRTLTKNIITFVEENNFLLLEKMAADILAMIAQENAILSAMIEIDKPHALRFADSVSVVMHYKKQEDK